MQIEWIEHEQHHEDYRRKLWEAELGSNKNIYLAIEQQGSVFTEEFEVRGIVRYDRRPNHLFTEHAESLDEAKKLAEALLKRCLPGWIEHEQGRLQGNIDRLNRIKKEVCDGN